MGHGEGDLHIGASHELRQGCHHAVGHVLLRVTAELDELVPKGERGVEVGVLALVGAEAELAQAPDALIGEGRAVRGQT